MEIYKEYLHSSHPKPSASFLLYSAFSTESVPIFCSTIYLCGGVDYSH